MIHSSSKFKETEPGLIPEDWKILKIKDIGQVVTGKTPPAANPEFWGEDIAFITPTDFTGYLKFANSSVRFLSESGKEKMKNILIPEQSVMITCIGSDMGKVAVTEKECVTNQQINSIIIDQRFANSSFVYYNLKNQYKLIRGMSTGGSTMPIINKTDFGNIEILFPSLPEQQKIAGILGVLDEKIELNRKMNKTLEQIAQAIFKKWFIDDADPNWETKKLVEVANIRKGLSYRGKDLVDSSENALAGIKCFKRGGGFNSEGLKPFDGEYKAEHLLSAGDLIVAMTDLTQAGEVLGKPALIPSIKGTNKIIASLDIVALDPTTQLGRGYLYLLLMRQESQDYLRGYSDGSTVLHLSINGLREFPVLIPDYKILEKFNLIIKPIFQKIQNNENQIINLSQIRDSLLPRLMSGKLRVI